jgi:cell division control protein 24
VQRICKYPLLLEVRCHAVRVTYCDKNTPQSLLKASNADDYPYYDELVEGAASTKRVTLRINEAQRRQENAQIVKNLESRIEDWKGHHITNFGDLLLQDFFSVTKSDVDRDYHVFLFEKIILCCKEDPRALQNGDKRKVAKSNSILKKQSTSGVPVNPLGGSASARKGTTPLLLKGRIFLNNVMDATPVSKGG